MTPLDINHIPLFTSLPEAARQELSAMLRIEAAAPGQIIIREGDVGDSFCIILDGEIEIMDKVEHRAVRLDLFTLAGMWRDWMKGRRWQQEP